MQNSDSNCVLFDGLIVSLSVRAKNDDIVSDLQILRERYWKGID